MEYGVAGTETCETERRIEHTIGRAFLAAHLLTASTEQAESAVTEAIESWDPDDDNEEALFQQVLIAAVGSQVKSLPSSSNKPDSAGSFLSPELQAVISLSPELRRCFVLRILVGLSSQVCARLLQLHSQRVNQNACAALKCLPSLADDHSQH